MKRALVIDDEVSIRLAVRFVLEDMGYAVEEACMDARGYIASNTTRIPVWSSST